jgi:hypothetical protein
MARVTENQLILPSLFFMSLSASKSITTSELIPKLRELLNPKDEDLEILAGRNDDKFSQIVRNLKAHDTFERYGFAKYKDGVCTITYEGEEYLRKNIQSIRYLLVNDFQWEDLKDGLETVHIKSTEEKRKIEIFDESIMIQEGMKKIIETQVYERSTLLRKTAIEYYSKEGEIYCNPCNFNFEKFYGKEIGKGYIEIHHVKPVFKYEGDELNKVINNALNNVIPICSNCHRMIHRTWKNPIQIDYLISQIKDNGIYKRI